MNFKISFIIFLIIFLVINCKRIRRISKREEEALEKEHRNAICCEKKMRCCVKPKPPPIEIRAILARCPNLGQDTSSVITRNLNKPMIPANEHNIRRFQGFDEDEPLLQARVTQCRRKILMTLKMHNQGTVNCKSQYIVVDHVYDPVSEKSVRLLNPYVVKLKQEPVSKSYFLKFIDYVNSEATEEVLNKHNDHYTGCYTDKLHATCGVVKYEGKIVPYSEGFCCSCDATKNARRQPESINHKNEAIISYSDPAYLLDRVQCPRDFFKEEEELPVKEGHGKRSEASKSSYSDMQTSSEFPRVQYNVSHSTKRWQYTTYSKKLNTQHSTENAHMYLKADNLKNKRQDLESMLSVDKSLPKGTYDQPIPFVKHLQISDRKKHPGVYMEDVKKAHLPPNQGIYPNYEGINEKLIRKIRQTFPSGVQKRGGQNCANRYTPAGLDPEHYHESTHCLRFSDVWYGIYKLGEPFVEQFISINIFERFETENNPDLWREITNGTIKLGNRNPLYEDETPTVSISLTTKTTEENNELHSLHSKRILIPEGIRPCDAYKYPEMKNGADEYLVVKPTDISVEGDQCDKIGVGFEAFNKQPQRCGMPRGTCLHNQPRHLWKHDKTKEKRNETGCYFLKYHANITKEPIIIAENGDKYLDVEYTGQHTTTIDIEIKADYNTIIRQQTTATITEIYVDSTCDKITIITAKVTNSGLISAQYMVQLSDFPLDYPEYYNHIKSKLVLISPQNQHIFTLQIRFPLPSDLLFCTLEVHNVNRELVALRRVKIQKYDRCICTWHCLCACVASVEGLKCVPMALEHYKAAGFHGSLPIVTHIVHFTLLDDLLSVTFYFALFLLGTLLLMGLCKALLGLCCYAIGIWGLAVLLDLPKRMKKYYEKHLCNEKVIYDEEGWPIDPKTNCRVRNISRTTEFCTNVVFFFTYPLACCMVIFRRLCCPYYTKKRCAKKCRITDGKSPNQKDKKRKVFSTREECKNPECVKTEKITLEPVILTGEIFSDNSCRKKPSCCESNCYRSSCCPIKCKKSAKKNKSLSQCSSSNESHRKKSCNRKSCSSSCCRSSCCPRKCKKSHKKTCPSKCSSSEDSRRKLCKNKSSNGCKRKDCPSKVFACPNTTMRMAQPQFGLPDERKLCTCTTPKLMSSSESILSETPSKTYLIKQGSLEKGDKSKKISSIPLNYRRTPLYTESSTSRKSYEDDSITKIDKRQSDSLGIKKKRDQCSSYVNTSSEKSSLRERNRIFKKISTKDSSKKCVMAEKESKGSKKSFSKVSRKSDPKQPIVNSSSSTSSVSGNSTSSSESTSELFTSEIFSASEKIVSERKCIDDKVRSRNKDYEECKKMVTISSEERYDSKVNKKPYNTESKQKERYSDNVNSSSINSHNPHERSRVSFDRETSETVTEKPKKVNKEDVVRPKSM